DLLCTAVYGTRAFDQDRWPQQAELAWPILGQQRLQRIDMSVLVAAGESMGIKPATAKATLQKMIDAVRVHASALLQIVEQENQTLAQMKPEVRATLAGELRLLRAIVSIVIGDITRQFTNGQAG
ncbi:MAG: type II toxin-antitoxin system HipA family toxin, partial [Anaerolineales bacterium]